MFKTVEMEVDKILIEDEMVKPLFDEVFMHNLMEENSRVYERVCSVVKRLRRYKDSIVWLATYFDSDDISCYHKGLRVKELICLGEAIEANKYDIISMRVYTKSIDDVKMALTYLENTINHLKLKFR